MREGARERPESPRLVVENLLVHQALECDRDDFLSTGRVPFYPVLCVQGFVGLADFLERRIKQFVSGRSGIDEMQRFEIRIDAILQGKIGDDGASHHAGENSSPGPSRYSRSARSASTGRTLRSGVSETRPSCVDPSGQDRERGIGTHSSARQAGASTRRSVEVRCNHAAIVTARAEICNERHGPARAPQKSA